MKNVLTMEMLSSDVKVQRSNTERRLRAVSFNVTHELIPELKKMEFKALPGRSCRHLLFFALLFRCNGEMK